MVPLPLLGALHKVGKVARKLVRIPVHRLWVPGMWAGTRVHMMVLVDMPVRTLVDMPELHILTMHMLILW